MWILCRYCVDTGEYGRGKLVWGIRGNHGRSTHSLTRCHITHIRNNTDHPPIKPYWLPITSLHTYTLALKVEWRIRQLSSWESIYCLQSRPGHPDDWMTGGPHDWMKSRQDVRKLRRRLTVWYIFHNNNPKNMVQMEATRLKTILLDIDFSVVVVSSPSAVEVVNTVVVWLEVVVAVKVVIVAGEEGEWSLHLEVIGITRSYSHMKSSHLNNIVWRGEF